MIVLRLSGKAKQVFVLFRLRVESEGNKTLGELETKLRKAEE